VASPTTTPEAKVTREVEAALTADAPTRAVELAREALEQTPDSAAYRELLGKGLERAGNVEGARAAYREALEKDPTRRHLGVHLYRLAETAGDAVAVEKWRPYVTGGS
jgi:Flp pilus assembly protein TadD